MIATRTARDLAELAGEALAAIAPAAVNIALAVVLAVADRAGAR